MKRSAIVVVALLAGCETVTETVIRNSFGESGSAVLEGYATPGVDGLVSWWGAERTARDRIGGNHGTLEGDASYAPGVRGQAFQFDGDGDHVRVPNHASLNPGQALTVEFWMKPDPSNSMEYCCQGLVTTDYYLVETSGGHDATVGVNAVIMTDVSPGFVHTSDGDGGGFPVAPGEWHYVVATYDGTALSLYVNGQIRQTSLVSGTMLPTRNSASFLSIGSEDGRTLHGGLIGVRYFHGLIDEVKLYNRALSADEVDRNHRLYPSR